MEMFDGLFGSPFGGLGGMLGNIGGQGISGGLSSGLSQSDTGLANTIGSDPYIDSGIHLSNIKLSACSQCSGTGWLYGKEFKGTEIIDKKYACSCDEGSKRLQEQKSAIDPLEVMSKELSYKMGQTIDALALQYYNNKLVQQLKDNTKFQIGQQQTLPPSGNTIKFTFPESASQGESQYYKSINHTPPEVKPEVRVEEEPKGRKFKEKL